MQTKDEAKANILELCSEGEYGSWEFWSDGSTKTDKELDLIFEAINELIKEEKILAMEHKSKSDYEEVEIDANRLRGELKKSMTPNNVDPDSFYWFEATEEGKKEDLRLRGKR